MQGLTVYIAGLLLNATLSIAVAVFAFRARDKPGGLALGLLMSTVAWWSLALAGGFSVTSIPAKVLWSKIDYTGAMSSPVFLLLFALKFANQERWLERRLLVTYWVIPVITIVLAWTNEWHPLIWTSFTPSAVPGSNTLIYGYGPWFWVMVAYTYLILTATTFLFLKAAIQRRYLYRQQTILLLVAVFPPWLVNLLYVFNLGPVAGWDLTPLGFAPTGILLVWSFIQRNLLDLVPITHDQVVESVHDSIVVLDPQNRILDINPAAQRTLGITPSLIGEPAENALPACLGTIDAADGATEVQIGDDPTRTLNVRTSPVSNQRGHTVGRLIVCRDVTEHRQVQQEIWEQQRALAVMEERQHVSQEAHNSVRQILDYIILQAQAVLGMIEDDETATAVAYLAHLITVAQDASTDIGKFTHNIQVAPAPAPGFFEALEQYVRQFGQTHRLPITLIRPPNSADELLAPMAQIQLLRITQEALRNVSRHAQARAVQVAITDSGAHVQVIIADDGMGFDSQAMRDAEEQTGLATMQRRAIAAGGFLNVRSIPDQGTHVVAHLPRRRPPKETHFLTTRVLLVDDHQVLLEGFKDLLEKRGVDVVGMVNDGQEAIEQVRALRPDVVLMDVKMPGMSGIEATRRIKEEFPSIKVVMLTVSEEEEDLFEALRSGASGYLLKSLDPEQFFSLLSQAAQGEAPLAPDLVGRLIAGIAQPDKAAQADGLSPRQLSILRLVAQGLTYKQVGTQLYLSESTVRYHIGQIREHLGVSNRAEMIAYAVRIGLGERRTTTN